MLTTLQIAVTITSGVSEINTDKLNDFIEVNKINMQNFFYIEDANLLNEDAYTPTQRSLLAHLSAIQYVSSVLSLSFGNNEGSNIKKAKADVVEVEFFDASEKTKGIQNLISQLKTDAQMVANRLNLILDFNTMNAVAVKQWFSGADSQTYFAS